jgi:hypothetical protein
VRALAFRGKEDVVSRALLIVLALLLAACGGGHTTRKREIGYKGKARLDAYLAAGRFLEKSGYAVTSEPGWPDFDQDFAVAILPASVVSTQAYARELEEWVAGGGHLICLVERAESYHDDWARSPALSRGDESPLPEDLDEWFERAGLAVARGDAVEAKRLAVDGVEHEVFAESAAGVTVEGGERQALGQVGFGEGIITVMADARPFRNRYLADHDHAALLLALVDSSPYEGGVVIVRDAALSLWKLLGDRAWPALLGLLALILCWLWKNLPRFGPLRRGDPPTTLRAYDHHLEALGDFHWRLDRGAALLRPLRESVLERAQRVAGARDADFFQWLAERAGLSRERAERAMTHERAADAASFVRLVADLQKIHLTLP